MTLVKVPERVWIPPQAGIAGTPAQSWCEPPEPAPGPPGSPPDDPPVSGQQCWNEQICVPISGAGPGSSQVGAGGEGSTVTRIVDGEPRLFYCYSQRVCRDT